MLQLLMHHVGRTDLTGIANCHVRGLYSIMLHNQDGNRVRLYFTVDNIDTHGNYMSPDSSLADDYGISVENIRGMEARRAEYNDSMNLGLHGHATSIRLEVLAGAMYNITAEVEQHDEGRMRRFIYSSPITGDDNTEIVPGERWRCFNVVPTKMRQGDHAYLEANQLHTIYVDGFCSWLVYERGDRVNNSSHFFSYNPDAETLAHEDDMYQPMSSAECQAILARVIALYQRGLEAKNRAAVVESKKTAQRAALVNCKNALSAARATSPSIIRVRQRRTDIAAMVAATGFTHPYNMIRMLTDDEWQRWCNRVQRLPDEEGISDTDFLHWASQTLAARTVVDDGQTAPAEIAEPTARANESFAQIYESVRTRTRPASAFNPEWLMQSIDMRNETNSQSQ